MKNRTKKTVPKQLGELASGLAMIINKMDVLKGNNKVSSKK